MSTRSIVQLGLLAAMSIVLTRTLSVAVPIAGVFAIRLSFGEIPIILGGLLFGPVFGAALGFIADIVGISLFPPPAIFPGFTLSSILLGVLPPLFARLFLKNGQAWNFRRLLVVVLLTDVIVSVGLNTLWLSIMFQKGILALLPARLVARAFLVPSYSLVLHAIIRTYHAVVRRPALAPR